MAVRTPLKLVGSDLKEMSSGEIAALRTEAIRQYAANPSVTLSVVASGGSLTGMTDTRQQAGAGITRVDRFATTAELGNVSNVSVSYDKINESAASTSYWSDATYSYPLYYDAGNLREMTQTDFLDTFILPAIDTMTTGSTTSAQAGTYFISSATSVGGATRVSATPVFTDTRADAINYTATGLIETQDQPTTITNYYLYRINGAAEASFELPICYLKSGTNLRQIAKATFQTALQTNIRHAASAVTGTRIRYSINGTGNNRGTAMIDTRLTGSKYLTYQVNTNDYRAQETPDYNASPTTISTYYLRITQT